MSSSRVAHQSLRLATELPRQSYVCRTCLAQAARKFSSTPRTYADDLPLWKRIQSSIFRTDKTVQQEQSRDEQRERRSEQAATRDKAKTRIKKREDGKIFEVAAIVHPSANEEYTPSTTWDGLERVGSRTWARARTDQGEQYIGFLSKSQHQLTSLQWQKLLHHITVEVLALQEAGRDVMQICNPRRHDSDESPATLTADAAIAWGSNTSSTRFAGEAPETSILDAIAGEETQSSEEDLRNELSSATSEDLNLPYPENDIAWMGVSLQDPKVKLAIVKRIMQLTGKRIRDPVISSASTLADLYHAIKVKEMPKKLAQTENLKEVAIQMPNVRVHGTRRTTVHKEKEIGRWKLIEDELKLRGLPVFGTTYQNAKEDLKPAVR